MRIWLPIYHDDFDPRHPELRRLVRALDLPWASAAGLRAAALIWMQKYRIDGNISEVDAAVSSRTAPR